MSAQRFRRQFRRVRGGDFRHDLCALKFAGIFACFGSGSECWVCAAICGGTNFRFAAFCGSNEFCGAEIPTRKMMFADARK